MRRLLPLLLALTLLAGCAAHEEESGGDYTLYYAARLEGAQGQDAVVTRAAAVEEAETLSTTELAAALLRELLTPPQDMDAISPFPAGTQLKSVSIAGHLAFVDLSEQYARLSGVDLSLADYCITLTLTQLDGVNAVTVTAEGRTLPYRRTQILTAADPLLGSREGGLRPITVSLYFLDTETNELRAQQQTLALHEGQTRVSALLDALLQGPENDDALLPLLPPEFSIRSTRFEEAACILDLAPDVPLPQEPEARALALDSLARSVLSLAGVRDVQVFIEGECVVSVSAE